MSRVREIGAAVYRLAVRDPEIGRQLQDTLGFTDHEMKKLYDGRLFLTGADLQKVCAVCGNELFQSADRDDGSRETILNLIDAYIDAKEALERSECPEESE